MYLIHGDFMKTFKNENKNLSIQRLIVNLDIVLTTFTLSIASESLFKITTRSYLPEKITTIIYTNIAGFILLYNTIDHEIEYLEMKKK